MRFLTLLFVVALTSGRGQAGPVCALLEVEKHPRAGVLEGKLLSDSSATWVERTNIDAVLKEQKLQAAFGPQGVGERVKLGRLLKADVLVLVRSVKEAKEPALEVVVSETGGGLRLLVRAVPLTKDSDADVQALVSAVREGIQKHGEAIKEVVAVPPFVSNNLEFTDDHLRGAFSKLAEAAALDRKGVVVVELEEAEALAKEIALAAPGSRLDRPLPVYLLGEYRHDGMGKERTVFVKLRAERDGKRIGNPEAAILKPDAAAETVRAWSAGILDALAKDDKPRPPGDPKAEAKFLAARARAFSHRGIWTECVALLEAALLLDPDQPDWHAELVKALTPLIRTSMSRATLGSHEEAERLTRLYRRGLTHLDAFADKGGDFNKYRDRSGADLVMSFRVAANFLNFAGSSAPQKSRDLLQALKTEEKATLDHINPIINKQFRPLPRLPRLPDEATGVPPPGFDPLAVPDPAANRLCLTPVKLTVERPGPPVDVFPGLVGLLSLGPNTDLLWSKHTFFLMKEKGKLQAVWTSRTQNIQLTGVRFDGRLVWITVAGLRQAPLLLILNPTTGKTYEVTAADGLPQPTPEQLATPGPTFTMLSTPLEPGRACVAGWIGRTWVAVVTFDSEKAKATVKLIHEARDAADRDNKDQWASTTVAFRPAYMFTLRDKPAADGTATTRVLLGRSGTDNLDVDSFPLSIDADKPAVEAVKCRVYSSIYTGSHRRFLTEADGAVWQIEATDYPRLMRIGLPGPVREVIAEAYPRNPVFVFAHDGRVHVVQERIGKKDPMDPNPRPLRGDYKTPVTFQWYTLEPGEKRPKLVGVDLPLVRFVAFSSHYGLVALVEPDTRGANTLHTVEFTEPKK